MAAVRVVAAMSGGVDSSVAAALLVRQGYEVIGVTMQIWQARDPAEEARLGGCCSLGAVADARRVAELLGIPYYVLNLQEAFRRAVIDDFVREYARGRTPNPCIVCNREIKFAALLERARELGAEYVASGHYARAGWDAGRGRWVLRRGRDARKDQSYVLYPLEQEQLAHVLFPLGGMEKAETRRLAAELGLPVAAKPESQEICFVRDGDYAAFLEGEIPDRFRPGPIVDRRGRLLGTHRGLPRYTVGQRRGLGVAAREPLYVLEVDAERNRLVVGTAAEAGRRPVRGGPGARAAPAPPGAGGGEGV
ncbi:MAG: tRNA 2-thiouridine(34) synthase MnmA, partial [Clostridia bacterium]|nr:tRNA 2-thiouridine(34) synthase MnmA [Clostridia bacterium]